MQKGTKEFYELRDMFEKTLKEMPVYIGASAVDNRADKSSSHFYENGRINDMFISFVFGWSASKAYHRN